MKKQTPPRGTPPSWSLPAALLLAAMGQFFLIQQDKPWTAWAGCVLYGFAAFLFPRAVGGPGKFPAPSQPLSPGLEPLLLLLILAVGAFFRLYRLNDFPVGIFPDEACLGWGSLRVLHEGWRPFYDIYYMSVWDQPLYYLLSGWFWIFPNTKTCLFLFSVFFSLLSFPLVYWTFRQLAGPRLALLTLFILAVTRWNITYSRDCHPAFQLPFYMFGTLAFWTYGIKNKKPWACWTGAAFFGTGFYAYQAYKPFLLLMALYILYEWLTSRPADNPPKSRIVEFSLISLALTAPLWIHALASQNFGPRERELFIYPSLFQDGIFLPLIRHFFQTALMFNREGDPWFLHNLPGHRMLDDVTGLLFILGLALAGARAWERKYFYPLVGLLVMSLPAFLSVNAAHASRAFGTIPFIDFLAALALSALWERARAFKPTSFLLAAALGLMAFQNFNTYFGKQSVNPDCWRGPAADATLVGEKIAEESGQYEYYLAPHYFDHYSVKFLGYSQKDHTHELGLFKDSLPLSTPPARGLFFALEDGQSGVLQLLQTLYPGGESETVWDPSSRVLVYFYRVPADTIERDRPLVEKFLKAGPGLTGAYFHSLEGKARPTLVHRDPLINFTFRDDFPRSPIPPFLVHWNGILDIPASGSYQFLALTTDQAWMILDGKLVFSEANTDSKEIFLGKGPHEINLFFRKTSGTDTALSLAWRKQGAPKYEVVPNGAFKPKP